MKENYNKQNTSSWASKLLSFVLLISIFLPINLLWSMQASSQSSSDIADQIDSQKDKLEETKNDIDNLEARISSASVEIENMSDGIPRVEAQIIQLELQIELNEIRLRQQEQEAELKMLEFQQMIETQKRSLVDTYKLWRTESNRYNKIFDSNTDFQRAEYFNKDIFGFGNQLINTASIEIDKLEKDIFLSRETLDSLESENESLIAMKLQLELEIASLRRALAADSSRVAGLKTERENIESTISNLLAEQQEAARKESEILSSPPPVNPPALPPETPPSNGVENGSNPGEPSVPASSFRIVGKGRDLYQGHGVGMSQWGAYGAALNGWDANQILTFYFTNVRIETRVHQISVQGYGVMDSNTYVAGLGEVPDKACGNTDQAAQNPQKYVVDNPNTVWDCWPEEAIKAQVIAARSYAIHYGGTICTTAACQVYNGGNGKRWAADETKDLVIVSNAGTHANQVINALYSSDNSQGSGTAHNDTIFQGFGGDGTPHSYLRAKNDSGFATPTSWTNWNYQTGSYNNQSIWNMLVFVSQSPSSSASQSSKNNVANLISGAGGVKSLSLEKDPSGRVKKIWITFDNDVVKSIGGWWFKNIWNNWAHDTGSFDYIFSQTFSIINN